MAEEQKSITEQVGEWFKSPTKFRTVKDVLSDFILTSPETKDKGIGGYRFTQMRDDEIEIGSNITDYVVESGMTIQDAVILKPLRLKLSGLAAEVSYGESRMLQPVDTLMNSLKPLNALIPSMITNDQKTADVYNRLNSVYGEFNKLQRQINSIIGIWSDNHSDPNSQIFDKTALADWWNNLTGSVQQKAFAQLYAMWQARSLINVETPWGVHKNLIIESVVAKQLARSNTYSEIEVTLKQITFATTQTVGGRKTDDAGRRNGQVDNLDNGQTGSVSVENTGEQLQDPPIYYFDGGNDPVSIRYREDAG